MSFRGKIAATIFAVSLLPALCVLIISAYLLNSTLSRVGTSGLEKSLQSAEGLVEETQGRLGVELDGKLPSSSWNKESDLKNWLTLNRLDLAFSGRDSLWLATISDSMILDISHFKQIAPREPGLSFIEQDSTFILVFARSDANTIYGCGILMPPGYSLKGKSLAHAITVSASLGMYKAFSLKLLAVTLFIMIALAIALSFFLSTIISRQLVRPLQALTDGAKVIGSGNFEQTVIVDGKNEFSKLAESFNNMALEIKLNQGKLLEAERLAAWREVARRIAHEIKNPLTPINIELYRLHEAMQKEENAATPGKLLSLDAIRFQIKSLQELAEQFSAFAKEPELRRQPCSLIDIITGSAEVFRSSSGAKITIQDGGNIPLIALDPQMMGRVFNNLIKNAIEAKPAGVKIEIIITEIDSAAKVVIKDNGPGFPSEKLLKIEQPYITSKKTGTGLGLLIIKKIVEEHGGEIKFYNDAGAVVEMMLPIIS
jgi:signal transduction histidine kinase